MGNADAWEVDVFEMTEPQITINGHALTPAQSMTVRCAIENFASSLEKGLGDDDDGKAMTAAYQARIEEIRRMIFG